MYLLSVYNPNTLYYGGRTISAQMSLLPAKERNKIRCNIFTFPCIRKMLAFMHVYLMLLLLYYHIIYIYARFTLSSFASAFHVAIQRSHHAYSRGYHYYYCRPGQMCDAKNHLLCHTYYTYVICIYILPYDLKWFSTQQT